VTDKTRVDSNIRVVRWGLIEDWVIVLRKIHVRSHRNLHLGPVTSVDDDGAILRGCGQQHVCPMLSFLAETDASHG